MAKWHITYEGDTIDDEYFFASLIRHEEMRVAIHDALDRLRTRRKYEEGISEAEYKMIEELQEILNIPGIIY